jgi:translation initiation factor IF-2
VVTAAVGDITQSDVERADVAGDAIILGFNVDMGEDCRVCLV